MPSVVKVLIVLFVFLISIMILSKALDAQSLGFFSIFLGLICLIVLYLWLYRHVVESKNYRQKGMLVVSFSSDQLHFVTDTSILKSQELKRVFFGGIKGHLCSPVGLEYSDGITELEFFSLNEKTVLQILVENKSQLKALQLLLKKVKSDWVIENELYHEFIK